MPEHLHRSWLIVAVGGATVQRAARAVRQGLPPRRVGLVGVRPRSDGRTCVLAKPFAQRPWATVTDGELSEGLLDRLAAVAASTRDQNALAGEFTGSLDSLALDVVVLLDANDGRSARAYRSVMKALAGEPVLGRSPAAGVRLEVLVASGRGRRLDAEVAAALREPPEAQGAFTDHVISFQPTNVERFTLPPAELADRAGKCLAALLRLGADHPVRRTLAAPATALGPGRSYWSMGYAAMTGRGEDFLNDAAHCYQRLLKRHWLRRAVSDRRIAAAGRNLLGRLIDSKVPNGELGRRVARWMAGFFRGEIPADGAPAVPTPADLRACLVEIVNELAVRSQDLSADQPNRPIHCPRPRDPRGWFKRLLHRITGGRIFRWQYRWEPAPDISRGIAARRARLGAFDGVVLNSQLAVERALEALGGVPGKRRVSSQETSPWPQAWIARLVCGLHHRALLDGCADRLAETILTGGDLLDVFGSHLAAQSKIAPEMSGLALVRAIEAAAGGSGDWLRQAFHVLGGQAAPWWGEPAAGGAKEQTFAFLPGEELFAAAKVLGAGVQPVSWDRQAYAVLKLLPGCVPAELRPAATASPQRPAGRSRDWIPTTHAG